MTAGAEQYPMFNIDEANLASYLAQTAAIAGSALCERVVDCHVNLATRDGHVDQENNEVIMHTSAGEWGESFVLQASRRRAATRCSATPETIVDTARQVSDRAKRLEEKPTWGLRGRTQNWDAMLVNARQLIPVVGKLLRMGGEFANQETPSGSTTATRLALNVCSSGRVYDAGIRDDHVIQLSATNLPAGVNGDFKFTFKHSGVADEEFAIARCSLRMEYPGEHYVTKDTLQQHGDALRGRWRQEWSGQGMMERALTGEYEADGQTIIDMAQAVINVADITLR